MENDNNADHHRLLDMPGVAELVKRVEMLHKSGDITNMVNFICYDITSLRKINHAYGRGVGDTLLVAVADWIAHATGGRVYRIEGDLFCIAFRDKSAKEIHQAAYALEARFNDMWPLQYHGRRYNLFTQASISVIEHCVEEVGQDRDIFDLFERALDISRHTRQVAIFNPEMDQMTREHALLQQELKTCVLDGMVGFQLYYQPIADPETGTWRGLEALCRWKGPEIGPVPPSIFIREVEEMGLIHRLGDWVVKTAIQTCLALKLTERDGFFVSVNVSALQIARNGYAERIVQMLEEHGYPFDKLLLEITESTEFTFNEMTVPAIKGLRARGVLFALDDFGSGYSGFSNLKNLPVDLLKTEREFIDNIENDSYLQYFYYIMSETAHANGMRLIAEGVENSEQLRCVVKNGADLIQGYLFGRPMDEQALRENIHCFAEPRREFLGWKHNMADLQHWINGHDAYKITPSLFRLQSRCIGVILDEPDLDVAVNTILGIVGLHFKINRVYVFLRDTGTVFSNRYEWCAEDVQSQIHLFQRIDSARDGFYDVLRENDVVIATQAQQLPDELLTRLETGEQAETVQSIAVMSMKQNHEIIGFVGFDDDADRQWTPEELLLLHNLCLICLIILARDDALPEENHRPQP